MVSLVSAKLYSLPDTVKEAAARYRDNGAAVVECAFPEDGDLYSKIDRAYGDLCGSAKALVVEAARIGEIPVARTSGMVHNLPHFLWGWTFWIKWNIGAEQLAYLKLAKAVQVKSSSGLEDRVLKSGFTVLRLVNPHEIPGFPDSVAAYLIAEAGTLEKKPGLSAKRKNE